MRKNVPPLVGGTGYITAAWVFLVAAVLAGLAGLYHTMSPGAATDAANAAVLARDACCMYLGGVLLAAIAAVLALLGVHKQATVFALAIGPTFHGSDGSGDDST